MTTAFATPPAATTARLSHTPELPEGWKLSLCRHAVIPFLTDPSGYCGDAGPAYRAGRYDNTSSPWGLTYQPTGWTVHFHSRPAAERHAARVDAADQYWLMAEQALRNELTSDEGVRRSRRAFALHEGTMIPGPADSLCECGGMLTHTGGVYLHVDRCESCRDLPDGATCPDTDGLRHLVCRQPAPVQCEHAHCRRPNALDIVPCDMDKICCGNH